MLRYWWSVVKTSASIARETLGVGHPKGWLISIVVWLLATYLAYAFRGKPEDVMDGFIIALCGFAAVGIMFFVLMVIQLVTLPPTLDAQAKARIGYLESIINTQKPPVGPAAMIIEKFADIAAEMAEHGTLDDADAFHSLRNTAREHLSQTLTNHWIRSFDLEFGASTSENIDPIYYFGRLENWLDKCANRITEDDLLPITTDPAQFPTTQS